MKVFFSYASQNSVAADEIRLALVGRGIDVFFDRQDLPIAGDFHERIRLAVEQSSTLLFLISPNSVAQGKYTLTELQYFQKRWPHPKDRVVPVLIQPTEWSSIPPYLRAVTILEPKGNIAAEVADALTQLGNLSAPSVSSAGSRAQGVIDALGNIQQFVRKHRTVALILLVSAVSSAGTFWASRITTITQKDAIRVDNRMEEIIDVCYPIPFKSSPNLRLSFIRGSGEIKLNNQGTNCFGFKTQNLSFSTDGALIEWSASGIPTDK